MSGGDPASPPTDFLIGRPTGVPPAAGTKRLRLTWFDAVLLVLIASAIVFVFYRIQVAFHYRWHWQVVVDFLVHYDADTGTWRANLLLEGLLTTVRLAIWAGVFAFVIGVALGLCRVSRNLFFRMVARTYVDLIRGIPPLVIIFVFYFFISSQIMPLIGIEAFLRTASPSTLAFVEVVAGPAPLVPAFISAMICLALFEGAYVAEIVRAGIESVERGQSEAAKALGLSRLKTMRYIILPQAIQRMMPPLTGQFVSLIKDTSIASLISVQEVAFMGAQVSSSTSRIFEVWITIAAMYFGLCVGLSALFRRLEARMQKHAR